MAVARRPSGGKARIIVPSPQVATYDLQPEMSAYELRDKLLAHLRDARPDLVVCNFANTDMVGHTGVLSAAVTAAEAVDACLAAVVEEARALGYALVVIRRSRECRRDGQAGREPPHTAHTTNLVPVVYVPAPGAAPRTIRDGRLADVAPTPARDTRRAAADRNGRRVVVGGMRTHARGVVAVALALVIAAAATMASCIGDGDVVAPDARDALFDLGAFVAYQDSVLAGRGIRKTVRVGGDHRGEGDRGRGLGRGVGGLRGRQRQQARPSPTPTLRERVGRGAGGGSEITLTATDSAARVRVIEVACASDAEGHALPLRRRRGRPRRDPLREPDRGYRAAPTVDPGEVRGREPPAGRRA